MGMAVAVLCVSMGMAVAAKEETAQGNTDRQVLEAYEEYQERLNGIERRAEIAGSGFSVIEDQIFPLETACYGEILLVPAMEERYRRLVLFFTKEDGAVVYRTDQLETSQQLEYGDSGTACRGDWSRFVSGSEPGREDGYRADRHLPEPDGAVCRQGV